MEQMQEATCSSAPAAAASPPAPSTSARRFTTELEEHGPRPTRSQVVETGCLGPCAVGPVALVYPDGVFYQNIQVEDVAEIVEEHLLKGRIVERLVSHGARHRAAPWPRCSDIDFFNRQVKIVLRNCGVIDPLQASRSTSPATATRRWPRRSPR